MQRLDGSRRYMHNVLCRRWTGSSSRGKTGHIASAGGLNRPAIEFNESDTTCGVYCNYEYDKGKGVR